MCESPEIRWPDGVARAGFVRWGEFNTVCGMPDCKDLAERYRETVAIRKARREDGKRARMQERVAARSEREATEIGRAAIRQYREAQRKARKAQEEARRKKRQANRGGPSPRARNRDADKGRGQLVLFDV